MRLMKRNLEHIWYCLYKDRTPVADENGRKTGEYANVYDKPVHILCSVSPATGRTQTEMFGKLDAYDKVIIMDDTCCPIDENTVLFIDKEPEFLEGRPLYDYTVRRVAKSLNHLSIAVSKVNIS